MISRDRSAIVFSIGQNFSSHFQPHFPLGTKNYHLKQSQQTNCTIGLYRDVWIAAIASSRKSLATRTAAICVRFHGRRVRHVYVTMQITFLARKSALIYRRGLRQRVASLTIDCKWRIRDKSLYCHNQLLTSSGYTLYNIYIIFL